MKTWKNWFFGLGENLTGPENTVESILDPILEKYKLTYEDICGERRTKTRVKARHELILMLHKKTNMSMSEIGELVNRSPSTVIYVIKRNA